MPVAAWFARRRAGAKPATWNRNLAALGGELSLRDADFRTWWAERHASWQTRGTKA